MDRLGRTVAARIAVPLLLGGALAAPAYATDIEGVQPFAVDIPHIYVKLQDPITGETLKVPGDPGDPPEFVPIQAFFDTGASGTIISRETAEVLGITPQTVDGTPSGTPIEYFDVGIGGYEAFHVARPLNVKLLDFLPTSFEEEHDPFNEDNFISHSIDNVRSAIRQNYANLDAGEEPIDLYGMPAMVGKVLAFDVGKTNELSYVEVRLHNPGSAAIPQTSIRIDVHYTDLNHFAPIDPPTATKPTGSHNPFIGTDPLDDFHDANKDITVKFNNVGGLRTSVDSWLFDTGGTISLISSEQALALGIHRKAFNEVDENGDPVTVYRLVDEADNIIPDQFTGDLTGVGSDPISPIGFYLESLTIPNALGEDIVFLHAPVMVADILLIDPDTDEEYILPGVLGMNYFAASYSEEAIIGTAFTDVVFNEPAGWIGLEINPEFIPEPGACSMLLVGAFAVLARRRRSGAA